MFRLDAREKYYLALGTVAGLIGLFLVFFFGIHCSFILLLGHITGMTALLLALILTTGVVLLFFSLWKLLYVSRALRRARNLMRYGTMVQGRVVGLEYDYDFSLDHLPCVRLVCKAGEETFRSGLVSFEKGNRFLHQIVPIYRDPESGECLVILGWPSRVHGKREMTKRKPASRWEAGKRQCG